jgi:hypothetical protein
MLTKQSFIRRPLQPLPLQASNVPLRMEQVEPKQVKFANQDDENNIPQKLRTEIEFLNKRIRTGTIGSPNDWQHLNLC